MLTIEETFNRLAERGYAQFATGDIRDTMLAAVQERIKTGKKPAKMLSKAIKMIELRSDRLEDAVVLLCDTYARMTTAQTRVSASFKARKDMLSSMPDKMLKDFGKLYIPDDINDFILPSEREELIVRLTDVMSEAKVEEPADATA